MEPEIQMESAHGDEGYVAPDVVRLGTVESLTDGDTFLNTPGDFTSQSD